MASDLYITKETLMNAAVADEADNAVVWDLLAESVSRMFDRECEVSDGFFSVASKSATAKTIYTNGTRYVNVGPYIPASLTALTVDGVVYFGSTDPSYLYRETGGYIKFDHAPFDERPVIVTARWGFASIAADIQQACIEMALQLWRKKDLSFADISGVSGAAVNAEFSPTFIAVTKRYREIYRERGFFA